LRPQALLVGNLRAVKDLRNLREHEEEAVDGPEAGAVFVEMYLLIESDHTRGYGDSDWRYRGSSISSVALIVGRIMLKEDKHQDTEIQDESFIPGPAVCVAGPVGIVEFQWSWNRLIPTD
jgi:hypothetical protein